MDKRSALVVSLLSLLLLLSFRGYAEPIWSGNVFSTPPGYSQTPSRFNITWSNIEAGSLVYLEENCTNPAGTNYSLSNYTDSVYNLSIVLPACSDAYWKSYASNSQGWNTSDTWYFTINKATANIALSVIPNTSVTYGMPTNATCTNSNPELSITKLYRNGTDVTALENNILFTLPGGTWNYYCNATDTNYTSSPKSYSFIVSKVPASLNLSLNGTQGNRTYTSNDTANFTVILNVSGNISLTSNYTGWINQNAFSPFYYYPSFYSVGNWSYLTASFDGNENYTASSPITYYFNVTDATPPAYLSSTIDTILAGYSTVFRTLWADNAGLSGYIFSTNNSGTWVNDSWTSFSGGNWSNITNKIINSTAGYLIQWEIYANDTSNNWNVSAGASFYTKLSDGSPCTADIQCFYNCVSSVCRQLNVCGDGHCDSAETCSFCPTDCGACQSTTTSSSSSGSSTPPGSFLIKDLASNLAILQGQSKPAQFTLSNTLANNIANVSVSVSGIDSSWYTLSKSSISILAHGSSQAMTITFNIPNSAEAKDYDVTISAKGKVLGETTSRTTTKTMTLIVNSSQPQPIQPLPSVTDTPQPQLATVQQNETVNITSNQTSVATGLAPAFEFFKSNLVIILAVVACLLIFIFRDNLTTSLGGTLGDEKAEKTHKSVSPLKILKDKLNYKVVVNLKKEGKARSLREATEAQGAEKVPGIISENVPEKGTKRPAILEKEIKRDIKELQSILDAEEKVKKNKKKFDMNNN